MPEELAPPVVAVVVASDPGDWFDACLESLCAQDYPNLALLVVDDASETELTSRVAAVEPSAVVRRRSERGGYARAANEARDGVEGATFFLFCHDDVVLEHDAVRTLVEESFRSNAAVVGPKLLDDAEPDRLRQVGLGMHRLGTPAPRTRPGELDQAQHDEAREVFAVPGACTLVRADLFEALEGYDAEMAMFGEDVDFCWRAQVAGARVAVAPAARARHRELAATGRRSLDGDGRSLQHRHEMRAVLKNYAIVRRLLAVLELGVLGLFEVVLGLASGERERSRRVLRSWRWNLAHRRSLVLARRHLREIRQVPDRALASRMARRGRWRDILRPELPEAPDPGAAGLPPTTVGPGRVGGLTGPPPGAAGRQLLEPSAHAATFWARARRGQLPTGQALLAVVLVLVGLLGLRDVLFARLPVVGQLVPMPPATTMLGQYLGGLHTPSGAVGPAPSGYGVVGVLGLVFGGSSATAWKVIAVVSLVAGAIGVGRLCKPFGSSRGRLIAAVAFVAMPFGWNAIATGDVAAAVTLGAAPFVLLRLGRATGSPPFGSAGASGASALLDRRDARNATYGAPTAAPAGATPPVAAARAATGATPAGAAPGGAPPGTGGGWVAGPLPRRRWRDLVAEIVPFGLLLALVAALTPAGLLACVALVVPVALVAGLSGNAKGAGRSVVVLAAAAAVAFCCCLPWSATWLDEGARWSALAGVVPGAPSSPASLLRGHTGPVGAWWGAFGVVAAGSYVLFVARAERLAWATTCWLAAAGSVAFGWAGSAGWLGAGGGAAAVLSAPAGAAIAAACGLGVAAFEQDVVARSALGWRQALAGVAGACLLVGAAPAAGVALGGRADLPAQGIEMTVDGLIPATAHGDRVLWLGDPRSLPGAGWQLRPGLAWYVTDGGLPQADQVWPSPSPGRLRRAASAVTAALSGATADVGAALAPLGIRYVVVPLADAPGLAGSQASPLVAAPPNPLLPALAAQEDLVERPVESGAAIFVNADWNVRDRGTFAAHAGGRPPGSQSGWRDLGLAAGLLATALALAEGVGRRRRWDRPAPVTRPVPLRELRVP